MPSLHVETSGSGPPLVLVHGWPQHSFMWRRVAPALERRFRVIRPDLPGHGRSPAPPGSYAKEELATAVLRLLDDLELERVRIVGHDWGGFAALLAALRAPSRFERVVALSIVHPWWRPPAPTPRVLALASYQYAVAAPIVGPRAVPRVVREVLARGGAHGFRFSDEEIETYVAPFRDPARAEASSALYRTFLTREVPALAAGRYDGLRLRVPALLATGERDAVVPPSVHARAPGHGDDVRTAIVPAAGHWVAEERPDDVLALLDGFL